MMAVFRIAERCSISSFIKIPGVAYTSSAAKTPADKPESTGEFRVFQLIPKKEEFVKTKINRIEIPPRSDQMAVDQDWPSVWPAARTFHPAVVPLPIRQGYPKKNEAPPSKWGNMELMKIPNFLHLTPPAIRRHCEALKQFCTEWPVGLETNEKCDKHFPQEYIYSDYCYSSPTIRDPLSRIVTLRIKVSALKLNPRAKDKLLRLLGPRYDEKTDYLTIVTDRCPTRKQNRDYADYLLTAVYQESWRVEPWELEKTLADMEYYDWDKNVSRKNLVSIRAWPGDPPEDLDYETIPNVTEYKIAVTDLINVGEDHFTVNKYRESVKNLLHLKKTQANSN
ncbi:28S ribosomal protein S35, mitochondrial [Microplitis demolitor]|uniref:28S ribosomal protein S35, mitochondrial n=1 Tax=Microplitis demolitor TaxID=69319 RepID=UPI0004CD3D4A|nr:28S ribosomal protein S35, mitochondrial [Microplitis demolitor]